MVAAPAQSELSEEHAYNPERFCTFTCSRRRQRSQQPSPQRRRRWRAALTTPACARLPTAQSLVSRGSKADTIVQSYARCMVNTLGDMLAAHLIHVFLPPVSGARVSVCDSVWTITKPARRRPGRGGRRHVGGARHGRALAGGVPGRGAVGGTANRRRAELTRRRLQGRHPGALICVADYEIASYIGKPVQVVSNCATTATARGIRILSQTSDGE